MQRFEFTGGTLAVALAAVTLLRNVVRADAATPAQVSQLIEEAHRELLSVSAATGMPSELLGLIQKASYMGGKEANTVQ
jgi:hypothetical protein